MRGRARSAGGAFAAGFLYTLVGTGARAAVTSRFLDAATLLRAALNEHKSASELLRRPRPELDL